MLVLGGDRTDIQELAIRARVRAVVVTGGLAVPEDLIEEARRHEVSLLISPFDTATTVMLCRAAIPVRHVQDEHFLLFHQDEPLSRVREVAISSAFPAFPVVDDEKRVVGILTKTDFLKPVDRKLILVDHNELSQAVAGADQVEILEIIDHHRIGALRTQQPILFRNEPVGSTSTIVADCFFRYGVELPGSIAGILLSGLVADTLNLTSPTTTPRDAEVLARLEWVGVNARAFTDKLFASARSWCRVRRRRRSRRTARSTGAREEVLGGADRGAGVRQFPAAQGGGAGRWRSTAASTRISSALLVTDVVEQTSLLLLAGADEFRRTLDYREVEPGIFEMPGVVSRKKQLLPYLTHQLARVPAVPAG